MVLVLPSDKVPSNCRPSLGEGRKRLVGKQISLLVINRGHGPISADKHHTMPPNESLRPGTMALFSHRDN